MSNEDHIHEYEQEQLNKMIEDDMWKQNPHATENYCNVKSRLLVVQELRNLQKIFNSWK